MPRLCRVFRTVLVASFALAVWTLARPAQAAPAPLCDDRGASALAPPPALEAPDIAVQRARATAACPLGGDLPLGASIGPAHRTPPPLQGAGEPVTPPSSIVVVPPTGEELDRRTADVPSLEGVRWRVERPPRG
jgi:hypothetical protein